MAEGMTITELAEAVGMTPRNIRAHQSKGLLFPPTISGRVAHYNGAHVARLAAHHVAAARGLHAGRHQAAASARRAATRPSSPTGGAGSARAARTSRATVPIPEERIRSLLPDLPEDLTDTGLAWRDDDGQLMSHTLLVGVGRMLSAQGVPFEVVAALQLDAVKSARELGEYLREQLARSTSRTRAGTTTWRRSPCS